MKKILNLFLNRREGVVLFLIFIFIIILSSSSKAFLTTVNLESLQVSIAPSAIVAFGMVILLISGVFDLSVGSTMALSGVVVSLLLYKGVPIVFSIIGALAVGILIGALNGFIIAYIGVNPLITTVGFLFIGRGIVYLLMQGEAGYVFKITNTNFYILGQGKVFGIYIMFLIMLILLIILQILISKTFFGRQLFYVGGNYQAAKTIGIKIKMVRVITYIFSGLMAALAGILMSSRFESASMYLGEGLEINIIISCLIGGATIAGGRGSIVGAFLGVVFMSILINFFNILEVGIFLQGIVVGLFLLLIITIDGYINIRRKRSIGEIDIG